MATEGSKITCSNCGRATLDARFCNWCGASQTASRDSGLGAIRNITSGVVALLALSVVSICGLAAPILASIAVLVAIAPSTEINPGSGPLGAGAYAVASILVFALGVVLTRRFRVWPGCLLIPTLAAILFVLFIGMIALLIALGQRNQG